jgi:hypothetical protein
MVEHRRAQRPALAGEEALRDRGIRHNHIEAVEGTFRDMHLGWGAGVLQPMCVCDGFFVKDIQSADADPRWWKSRQVSATSWNSGVWICATEVPLPSDLIVARRPHDSRGLTCSCARPVVEHRVGHHLKSWRDLAAVARQ